MDEEREGVPDEEGADVGGGGLAGEGEEGEGVRCAVWGEGGG